MTNQKGITLIALVITIIVLLILAGVSIAMLTGDNGILTKSSFAAFTGSSVLSIAIADGPSFSESLVSSGLFILPKYWEKSMSFLT